MAKYKSMKHLLDFLRHYDWIGYNKLDHIYVDFQIKYNYEESRNIKIGRNSYTDEFKKQIVLLYQNGKTILEIFKEYGMSKSAVYQWIEKLNNYGSFKAKDNRTVEENELIALWKELIQLRMENDILKQAALIIGKK